MSKMIKKRLKEPSTYVGLSVLFLALDAKVDPELMSGMVDIAFKAVEVIGAGLAVILAEFKD